VSDLIGEEILKAEDIPRLKGQLFDLLTSSDEKVRSQSWKSLSSSSLIKDNIVQRNEIIKLKNRFFDLLQSKVENVRTEAWQFV